jgi:hypothetical protein
MITYYRITELIAEHLKADRDVNTVIIGNLDQVDLNKQTIFPFSHILINSSQKVNGVENYNITVSCMDVVDVTKKDIRDEEDKIKGIDNKQDVLNTQHAVLENLETSIRKGTLQEFGLELTGEVDKLPFEDRFRNLLTGWSGTFTVSMPNEIQGCGNSYVLGDITFSNDLITFSNDNNS